MGDFRVVVDGFGAHGCEREKGDGQPVLGCDRNQCPDCIAREYVRRLKRQGCIVRSAKIIHWPAGVRGHKAENEIIDDLVSGIRKGTFPKS